jgi:hypothetical protein
MYSMVKKCGARNVIAYDKKLVFLHNPFSSMQHPVPVWLLSVVP